jgi:ribosomal protein L31E
MAEKEKTPSIERIYTIPLRKEWLKEPRARRTKRSILAIRDFVRRHTKSKKIKISKGVNELIFSRGFKKPPGRIKIEVHGDLETVQAKLPGEVIEKKEEKKKGGITGLKEKLTGRKEETKPEEGIKEEKKEIEKKPETEKEKPKGEKKSEKKEKLEEETKKEGK